MANNNQQQDEPIIKVISESFVKPKHEIEEAKHHLYLGPVDLVLLQLHPIQKGLLYSLDENHSSSSTISNVVAKLKQSLSVALLHFYPLAGRFETRKFDDENACTVYIDCDKGPGARLIHADAINIEVSDVLSPIDVPKFVHRFFDLGEKFINYDCHDYSRPLLSIQVTQLLDGMFIGFTMSHSVVDGTSFMHFVSILSEIFCSSNTIDETARFRVSRVPIFDYKPRCDNDRCTIVKMPYLGLEKVMMTRKYPGLLRERIFHFSKDSVARLKVRANVECTTGTISSFQALVVLLWRSITMARKLASDQQTTCFLVMNARTRLDPPISDNYVGNFLAGAKVTYTAEELLSHDLGWAAMRVNDSIKAQNGESILGTVKWVHDFLSKTGFEVSEGDNYHGPNPVIVGGSTRFDMYGSEFGLGKPVGVRMGFASKEDGKITANPGREDGSIDLEVSLTPDNMAALELDQEFMSYISFYNYTC